MQSSTRPNVKHNMDIEYVDCDSKVGHVQALDLTDRLIERNNVRFGSIAVVHHHISRTAAFGRIADTRQLDFESPRLNVRFHQKRSFKSGNLGEIRVRFRPLAVAG